MVGLTGDDGTSRAAAGALGCWPVCYCDVSRQTGRRKEDLQNCAGLSTQTGWRDMKRKVPKGSQGWGSQLSDVVDGMPVRITVRVVWLSSNFTLLPLLNRGKLL